MIVQSVAKQYGIIPSDQELMHYSEWLLLVSGLMEDTPLGQTVLIRREDDRERLKHFSQHEHAVRNRWREFRAGKKAGSVKPEEYAKRFEMMFAGMF